MDNTKFIDFVEKHTRLQRRGIEPGRKPDPRLKKFDEDNARLASQVTHDCQYCKQQVTNQVIYIQRMHKPYSQQPYWRKKCISCRTILNDTK
jgi:hypothetical protein